MLKPLFRATLGAFLLCSAAAFVPPTAMAAEGKV